MLLLVVDIEAVYACKADNPKLSMLSMVASRAHDLGGTDGAAHFRAAGHMHQLLRVLRIGCIAGVLQALCKALDVAAVQRAGIARIVLEEADVVVEGRPDRRIRAERRVLPCPAAAAVFARRLRRAGAGPVAAGLDVE